MKNRGVIDYNQNEIRITDRRLLLDILHTGNDVIE